MPQKYEREIDDILRRMGDWLPREPLLRRIYHRARGWLRGWPRQLRITPTHLMATGLILALLGYLARPFVPAVGFPVSLLALALFVGALALSIAQNRRRRSPGWRGRSLTNSAGSGVLWEGWIRRLRAWRNARRRGPRY